MIFICRINLFLLFILLFTSYQTQASGAEIVDTSFGSNGYVWQSMGRGETRGAVVALQEDGNVLVALQSDYRGNTDIALARYDINGKLDLNFGKQGIAKLDLGGRELVYGLKIARNGKIILAGYSVLGKNSNILLVRYQKDGSLDPLFGGKGYITTRLEEPVEIHYLAMDSHQRIVVGGFIKEKENIDFLVARFLPNGAVDLQFGEKGFVRTNFSHLDKIYGLTLQKDNKILVSGSIFNQKNLNDCAVARYLPTGILDNSFGHSGITLINSGVLDDLCMAIITNPNQNIKIAGFSQVGKRNVDFLLASLKPNGAVDLSFGKEGIVKTDFERGIDMAHDLIFLPGDDILLAGEFEKTHISSHGIRGSGLALVRYSSNGNLISDFGTLGRIKIPFRGSPFTEISSMTSKDKNKIYVTGTAHKKSFLARYFID